jgi:hypothetical protein
MGRLINMNKGRASSRRTRSVMAPGGRIVPPDNGSGNRAPPAGSHPCYPGDAECEPGCQYDCPPCGICPI